MLLGLIPDPHVDADQLQAVTAAHLLLLPPPVLVGHLTAKVDDRAEAILLQQLVELAAVGLAAAVQDPFPHDGEMMHRVDLPVPLDPHHRRRSDDGAGRHEQSHSLQRHGCYSRHVRLREPEACRDIGCLSA